MKFKTFLHWLSENELSRGYTPKWSGDELDAHLRKKASQVGSGLGWKIHLTTVQRPNAREEVAKELESIRDQSRIQFKFKILSGGEAGEKDLTVYVGPRKFANAVATWIHGSNALTYLLKDPAPGVKQDDIELVPGTNVYGRFDAASNDERFAKYGNTGWDLLQDDKTAMTWRKLPGNKYDPQAARQRAYNALAKIYGDIFTG